MVYFVLAPFLEPPGVLGILRLPPFWACFSLGDYLVYFVLTPFWSLRECTSFWLRFGALGVLGILRLPPFWACFSLWGLLGILRFGSVLEPPEVLGILCLAAFWSLRECTSFGSVLGLF